MKENISVLNFCLEDASFNETWKRFSAEQQEIFCQKISEKNLPWSFLEQEEADYATFRDKLIAFQVSGRVVEGFWAWREARPDMLRRWIEQDDTISSEYKPLLEQAGKNFLLSRNEEREDDEIFSHLSVMQRNLLIRQAEGILREIQEADKCLLDELFRRVSFSDGEKEIDYLPDYIQGRADLFLKFIQKCGPVRDVHWRHKIGRNAGEFGRATIYPLGGRDVPAFFEKRFGFKYPIKY